MSWTPNLTGLASEPHSYPAVIPPAPLPFTPYAPNRDAMRGMDITVEAVTLVFQPVLAAIPDECFTESIKRVWINGPRLQAGQVTAPPGWQVVDVTATAGWPGTTVEIISPTAFEGLTVALDLGGANVRRIVAQTEWRGEPGMVVFEDDDGGPGGVS